MAASFLVIGVLGFAQALLMSMRTQSADREHGIATEAVRQRLEILRSENFGNVFRRYNADPNDDPGAAGSGPGSNFAVAGLNANTDDADGFVGEILFPATAAAPTELREDFASLALGTPRDLNADGVVDAVDHSGNYALLPVVVRVSWRSTSGPATVDLRTILGDIP